MLHPYYHISFNGKLAGRWTPRTPDGFEHVPDRIAYDNNLAEPNIPRVCLSNSIDGCAKAVYPNVYQMFGRAGTAKLEFYVYRTYLDTSDPNFKGNASITQDRLVWDAHLTGEVWWLGELEMQLYQKIRLGINNKLALYGHPFADEEHAVKFCSYEPKIEVVKRYPAFYDAGL